MAKNTVFRCSNETCNYSSTKYFGLCPECKTGCGEEQEVMNIIKDKKGGILKNQDSYITSSKKMVSVKEVEVSNTKRVDTKFEQLNQLFGGEGKNVGIMPDSLNVFYGSPGVGKSTLLLQLLENLSSDYKCAYISGEENEQQLKKRYDRLGLKGDFDLTSEDNILALQDLMQPYDVIIIDSINAMYKPEAGIIGGVSQLKECSLFFMKYAKDFHKIFIIIAQVTKDNEIAGPNFFKHMVDALFTYTDLDDSKRYKCINADKNRFGNTMNSAILEMHEKGLTEIKDPSFIFTTLEDDNQDIFGSAMSMTMQGQRPIFIEIDSLVVETKSENSFSSAVGIEKNKYNQLLAIINKYLDSKTFGSNVYSAVSGGLKLYNETQLDLAIIASILSSQRSKNIKNYIFIGEVSLNGSIKKHAREKDFLEHIEKMKIQKEVICYSKNYTHIRDLLKIFK